MRARLGWIVLVGVVAAALGVGGATAAATMSGGAGTVKAAQNSTFGSLLVNAAGWTLYHFTAEKGHAIACTGACAKIWLPLVVTSKPTAGAGVNAAKLSTVKRPDGKTQVTYAGFALYRYAGDAKPGDVKGQGVLGKWFAVTSAGTLAKAKASSGGYAAPTPTTTTTMGDGGYTYP
jgi:predicted lipoprotein with Yx(FWY)xxD motif